MNNKPKVGELYHFWDDGKCSASRHYIAKCEQIISLKEANTIKFPDNETLMVKWVREKKDHNWIFSSETDAFVKCSIPKYDKDDIYFVRTKDGGWFSMNTTNWWQGGRLDVSGETYEEMLKYWEDNEEVLEMYTSQTYD